MQYSISQSDNNACDILIEYAGGIKHINDYIHRLSIDSFNLSETEDGMHPASRLYTATGVLLPLWSGLLRTSLMKRVVLQQGAERLLVADHDRYWKLLTNWKGMLPAKTVVGHKTGSSDRNADGMKTADNDAGLVILPDGRKYYIAAFVMDSYETDEDNAWTSSPAYHAWYMMRWDERGKGLLVAPASFDTRVYPAEKYSCCARNLCGNNNAEARCWQSDNPLSAPCCSG